MSDKNNAWEGLLSKGRRKKDAQVESNQSQPSADEASPSEETRTEIERDYDRILFSTPLRRLADKTQVFPLDRNDSVRTRLTHSYEVSNLARSIGTTLAFNKKVAAEVENALRDIPALLAAIGLAHDLGNPPFGHQGEAAIQSWFKTNSFIVFETTGNSFTQQQMQDFLKFEGNAQGFRLVTRLQLLNDNFGLDLTYATLAAMMKYPVSSVSTNNEKNAPVAHKKHGFFAAEQHIAEAVLSKAGLKLGQRHPLAYVMEACDDIAYVVLDVEDAVKKGLSSFSDLMSFLRHHSGGDEMVEKVVAQSCEKHDQYRAVESLSPAELNDVSMQRFRVFAIGELVKTATDAFIRNEDKFLTGLIPAGLISLSGGETLRKLLKQFALKHAYKHKSVLELELQGYNVITGLMDIFWAAIVDREDTLVSDSARRSPFTRYVYGRISENYRRVYENPTPEVQSLPMRYRDCLLLTDMISGMTDSYALNLFKELSALKGDFNLALIRN